MTDESNKTMNSDNGQVPQAVSDQHFDLRKYGVKDLADLIKSQPKEPDFLVDGLLPAAGISIVGGKPKDGKSTLVRNMIHAIATGNPFLGMKTKKGPVLYLALEETEYFVAKHFEGMGVSQNMHVHTVFSRPSIADLKLIVGKIKPVLVVIDPLFLFIEVKDGNSYTEVYSAMGQFTAIARMYETHVLTVHHIKKGTSNGPDSLLGSTALFGSVHTMALFESKGQDRLLTTKQKYGRNLESAVLKFDPSKQTYSYSGLLQESKVEDLQRKILHIVEEMVSATQKDICDSISGRREDVLSEIEALVQSGKLVKEGSGAKNSPFKYSVMVDGGDQ